MIDLSGRFYRVKFVAQAADILAPAHSPEGRFHHDGQAAIYPLDSDKVRDLGADGMIYASRKRPDLSHLVLFRWNRAGAGRLARAGDPLVYPDPA